MAIFWDALLLTLAAYDADFTIRYVTPELELNPAIRWLAKHVGWTSAVLAGIALPTAAVLAVSHLLLGPTFTAFVCGARALLTISQFNSPLRRGR